jgi:hypothetical protein
MAKGEGAKPETKLIKALTAGRRPGVLSGLVQTGFS